jgi:hypothetical protein
MDRDPSMTLEHAPRSNCASRPTCRERPGAQHVGQRPEISQLESHQRRMVVVERRDHEMRPISHLRPVFPRRPERTGFAANVPLPCLAALEGNKASFLGPRLLGGYSKCVDFKYS